MVHQAKLVPGHLAVDLTGFIDSPELLEQALGVRPRDGQTWDLRDVGALGTGSVLVRRDTRGRRVTRVRA
jgi:hypothetical protein